MIKKCLYFTLLALSLVLIGCANGNKKASGAVDKPVPVPVSQMVTTVQLMKNTPYVTPAYIYESSKPGPAVMVVGGVHGNEPAGAAAAKKFCDVKLLKGTLIVIPRANETALQANIRTLPEVGDLNRAYPGKEDGTPSQQLTYGIVQLMKQYKVAMVLDLHEGYAFNAENKESVGESILPGKDDMSALLAMDAVEYVNKDIMEDKKKFNILANPIAGSTAYYANTVLKIPAFTIETSDKQPIEDRVKYSFTIAKFLVASTGIIAK
jgi:predicted deacylase